MRRVIERFHPASGGYVRITLERDPRTGKEKRTEEYFHTSEWKPTKKESDA